MSVTSQGMNSAPVSAVSALPSASRMSTKATLLPWPAKARTMSAPMPLAPPVTKTTRPARLG
jgi:hypothetical protein